MATSHFILENGGAVKFVDNPDWMELDKNETYSLPGHFDKRYVIEAIDASGLPIMLESFDNFSKHYI